MKVGRVLPKTEYSPMERARPDVVIRFLPSEEMLARGNDGELGMVSTEKIGRNEESYRCKAQLN